MPRLSPGTDLTEKRKGPQAPASVATAVGGILGRFERGAPNVALLVTSLADAKEVVGEFPPDAGRFTQSALEDFFNHGGKSCYVSRVVGAGAVAASRMLQAISAGVSAGALISGGTAFPVALVDGDTFNGKVDGGVANVVTIGAKRARKDGTAATYAAVPANSHLDLAIGGVTQAPIVFDGTENTQAKWFAAINSQITNGAAIDNAGQLRLLVDQAGTGSSGSVLPASTAAVLTALGLTTGAFTLPGGSNVANANAVTAAELAALFNATFTGSTTTTPTATQLAWTTNTPGVGGSVQLSGGTGVAKISGFDNATHAGAGQTPVDTLRVSASSVGAWGNRWKVRAVQVNTAAAKLIANVASGTVLTSFSVDNDGKISVGDTISITDAGANTVRGVVEVVDGNVITLRNAVTVSASGWTAGLSVTKETLNLYVFDRDNAQVRSYIGMGMDISAGANYVENFVNNASRTPIFVTVQVNGASDKRPLTDGVMVAMSGGAEGAAPGSVEYVGSPSSPKTGVYAFDKVADVNMISAPGITDTATVQGLEAYGEYRQDVVMILETPQGFDRDAAKTWVAGTVNLSSSFEAVYFPWVKKLDRVTKSLQVKPPSGVIQGIVARTHANRNFGKAPAGIVDGKLVGIQALEFDIDDNDYESMYPLGINAIRNFPGEGIVVWGNRTMDPTGEWGELNIRIAMNIIKRVIKKTTRFVNFEPNNPKTRGQVVRVLTAYFRGLKENGGSGPGILQGEKDNDAFFIVCNETNNTPLVISQRRLVCQIGLAFNHAAEFQEYTLEQDTRAIDAALAAGKLSVTVNQRRETDGTRYSRRSGEGVPVPSHRRWLQPGGVLGGHGSQEDHGQGRVP